MKRRIPTEFKHKSFQVRCKTNEHNMYILDELEQ